jgi:hypothetical protein
MKAIVTVKFHGRSVNAHGIFEDHQDDIVVEDWPDDAPQSGNWENQPKQLTEPLYKKWDHIMRLTWSARPA